MYIPESIRNKLSSKTKKELELVYAPLQTIYIKKSMLTHSGIMSVNSMENKYTPYSILGQIADYKIIDQTTNYYKITYSNWTTKEPLKIPNESEYKQSFELEKEVEGLRKLKNGLDEVKKYIWPV